LGGFQAVVVPELFELDVLMFGHGRDFARNGGRRRAWWIRGSAAKLFLSAGGAGLCRFKQAGEKRGKWVQRG